MSARLLNLALVILLLAAAAFVIDVLSPYTPTPTAASAARVVFVLFCLLHAMFTVKWTQCFGVEFFDIRPRVVARPAQRTLLAMICSLLC